MGILKRQWTEVGVITLSCGRPSGLACKKCRPGSSSFRRRQTLTARGRAIPAQLAEKICKTQKEVDQLDKRASRVLANTHDEGYHSMGEDFMDASAESSDDEGNPPKAPRLRGGGLSARRRRRRRYGVLAGVAAGAAALGLAARVALGPPLPASGPPLPALATRQAEPAPKRTELPPHVIDFKEMQGSDYYYFRQLRDSPSLDVAHLIQWTPEERNEILSAPHGPTPDLVWRVLKRRMW